ncbi:MAG: TetR/AcrR family transcriptional regulator [Sciscionella sp.]
MTVSNTQDNRPRRRYAPRLPPQQRRAQLLDAAFEVLGHGELHELNMEAVARAAGVGKPVLYTVFRTRSDLVAALLRREREQAINQVRETMPTDLHELGPTGAYAATVSAFVRVVLANPTRWRLILTMPEDAPREYRDDLRLSRAGILAQAQTLARAGISLEPRLAGLDPVLLAHTMLSFAEMLGRLAVTDPHTYTSDRLAQFANAFLATITGPAPQTDADG